MAKIKFTGASDLVTKGITLVPGGTYDVSKEVAEYLVKTFGVELLDSIADKVVDAVKAKVKTEVGTKVASEK